MSRDSDDYCSLSDDYTDSARGYSREDGLDSDLDEVPADIFDDDCDDDDKCEVDTLFTRPRSGRSVGTWHIFSYLSRLIVLI